MGGGYWSTPFYREAELREPSPLEVERVRRRQQEAATTPSSRAPNAAESAQPTITPARYMIPSIGYSKTQ